METKRGLLGARQLTGSIRQRVKTKRSEAKVQKDTGKRGVGENMKQGSIPRVSSR